METDLITREAPVISETSNERLLSLMAKRNDDLALADQAFTEFYNRHRDYVFRVACKAAIGLLDDDEKSDLAQETFIRAYEKSHTFKGKIFDDATQERKWARAWLGKIANNLLIDKLRKKKGALLLSYDDEKVRREAEWKRVDASLPKSSGHGFVQEALELLAEKERQILRLAALNYSPGDKELRIPESDLDELAKTYNVSKDSIRQTKKRAKEKVRKYLEARFRQKGGDIEL
ncbi:MAG TPA: sigma-70 family RNA polymerase sigma factor [Blastocatellia bacterium]|nr:sigma-70 family RNA polymerase sigma factor [Blastocatellia bacterium]